MALAKKMVTVVYNGRPGAEILVNLQRTPTFTRFKSGVPASVEEDALEILLKDMFSVVPSRAEAPKKEPEVEGKKAVPVKVPIKTTAGKEGNLKKKK